MKWPRFAMVFSIVVLLISGQIALAATEDEQWVARENFTKTFHAVVMESSIDPMLTFPLLTGQSAPKNEPLKFDRYVCKTTSDVGCNTVDFYHFNAPLPICSNESQLDCIESVQGGLENQNLSPATFNSYLYKNHPDQFQSNPKLGIPYAESPSVWNINAAPHNFGSEYVVSASVIADVFPDGSTNWTRNEVSAYLMPISRIKSGAKNLIDCKTIEDRPGLHNNGCNTVVEPVNPEDYCAFGSNSSGTLDCLTPHAFPTNSNFRIILRLSKEPTSWLHGRLVNPVMDISKYGSGIRVSVQASPTRVPVIYYGDYWEKMADSAKQFWQQCEDAVFRCNGAGMFAEPLPVRTGTMHMFSYGNGALAAVNMITKLTNDKAIVVPSAWSFHSLPSDQMEGANNCFKSGEGLKGIVTTNSTAYSEGPPTFANGELQYHVAAPHFNSDGSIFKGNYDLVIRSDVARCLYGFSNAPISAAISIVTESGNQDLATTLVRESDGWIFLSAKNFTFSSPVISVKFNQEKVTVVTPPAQVKSEPTKSELNKEVVATPTNLPISKTPTKSTITCIKGKVIKKVTAIKPVCPSGFKKKA